MKYIIDITFCKKHKVFCVFYADNSVPHFKECRYFNIKDFYSYVGQLYFSNSKYTEFLKLCRSDLKYSNQGVIND